MHTGMLWFDNDPRTTLSVKNPKSNGLLQQKIWTHPRYMPRTSQHVGKRTKAI